jgi:lysophospholipase L1-like esterase
VSEEINNKQIRYLALGDSYTIGENVKLQQSIPYQLSSKLRKNGYNMKDPDIIAKTGWTTGNLLSSIESYNPNIKFDVVTLLIGVNNQFQGRSIEQYRSEFKIILNKAIKFADNSNKSVIVFSIPDWGVTPFADRLDRKKISQEIDKFNEVNQQESKKAGVHYIDVTSISRKAAFDPTLLAVDGLHPSGKMYKKWVDITYPIVIKMLSD